MGPGALAQVLRPLSQRTDPNLIVGLQTSDDAAVYRLNDELALIQTVDFFPPVVDDPYVYGGIAAANAMSDVYAMGGEVMLALNIAAFPDNVPLDVLSRIFEGGADKAAEAGVVIAGGHTVTDDEPKYGLVVTGTVHPKRILTKAGARPGDVVYLTKPLGTGVITTALKSEDAAREDVDAAVSSMLRLNREAARLTQLVGAHACTDITGFGLVGHVAEVAEKSGVRIVLRGSELPLLAGALRYAADGHMPGGASRNRQYFGRRDDAHFTAEPGVPAALLDLLFDPETSGGLLILVGADHADALERAFGDSGEPLWRIGEADSGSGVIVTP